MLTLFAEVDPNSHDVPRVSQYRLAAHLTSAFALYSAMVLQAVQSKLTLLPIAMDVDESSFPEACTHQYVSPYCCSSRRTDIALVK